MARIELSNIGGGGTTLSLTTTGTSGASTLAGSVLNIPVYQGQLTLTTTGTSGAATLSGDILNIPQYSGGGTPAGSAGQVQFNSTPAGSFTASANLAWDNTAVQLNINAPASPTGKLNVKGSGATSSTVNTRLTDSGNTELLKVLDNGSTNIGANFNWDNVNGRLGLGTSTPNQTLEVSGAMRLTGTAGTAAFMLGRNSAGDVSTVTLGTTGTSGAATLSANVLNIPQYQGALTLTTTGTSGAATLVGDILNIPQYSGGGGTPAGSTGEIQYNNAGAFGASANLAWDNTNVRLNIGAPSSPAGILNIKGASAIATQNMSITNSSNLAVFSALNDQTVGIGTSSPSNTLTVRANIATINTELPSFSHNYINTIYSRPNSNASLAPYSSSVGGMIFTGIARTNTPSLLFLGATNDTATATMAPVVFCGLRRNSANNNTTAVASGELCVSFYNGATGFDIGTRLASFFGDGSLLISSGASSSAKLHVIGTNTTANVGTFLVQDGAATPSTIYRIDNDGKVTYRATNTAAGTTGAQTINRPSGTVNFAAGATALVVTNSLCTTASLVFAEVRTNDATAQIKNVVPAAGSFTINLGAAATAETSVGFFIIN